MLTYTLRSSSEPRGLVRDIGAFEGGTPDPGRAAALTAATVILPATSGCRDSGVIVGVENAASEVGDIIRGTVTRMAE